MDYKKIFRTRKIRNKILKMLSILPDEMMLKIQYKLKLNRNLQLKNPKRFTEKLQLYKLKYRNPVLSICVDKVKVRDFLRNRGLESILLKQYGVYRRGEEINFDALPDQFVIKTNDGGGGNNVLICKDKGKLNIAATVRTVNSWLNVKDINPGREWAYTGIPESLILVEEFLENRDNPHGGLEDFKFFCFNGQPLCVVHDGDRYIGHKRNFYDLNWKNLNIGSDCQNFPEDAPKPQTLKEMVEVASVLSNGFPFVRVDLYSVGNKVFFGELTFYPWSGYVQFSPDSFDFELGQHFDTSSFL